MWPHHPAQVPCQDPKHDAGCPANVGTSHQTQPNQDSKGNTGYTTRAKAKRRNAKGHNGKGEKCKGASGRVRRRLQSSTTNGLHLMRCPLPAGVSRQLSGDNLFPRNKRDRCGCHGGRKIKKTRCFRKYFGCRANIAVMVTGGAVLLFRMTVKLQG